MAILLDQRRAEDRFSILNSLSQSDCVQKLDLEYTQYM